MRTRSKSAGARARASARETGSWARIAGGDVDGREAHQRDPEDDGDRIAQALEGVEDREIRPSDGKGRSEGRTTLTLSLSRGAGEAGTRGEAVEG